MTYWETVSAVIVGYCFAKTGGILFGWLIAAVSYAGERLWAHVTRQS